MPNGWRRPSRSGGPELETALGEISPDDGAASPKPSTDDRLAELLDLARSHKAEIDAVHEAVRQLRRPSIAEVLDQPRGIALMRGGNATGIGGSLAGLDRPLGLAEGGLRYGLRAPRGFPRTKDELVEAMDEDRREREDEDEPG